MRSYGQYCPIARGSEVIAERWTPIIVRNILQGNRTFNRIAAGAPGLSRALLSSRLRELERAGIITMTPKRDGRGCYYDPTPAGRELAEVLQALGTWADRWMGLTVEDSDPSFVLWSWCNRYLQVDRLPDRRVVTRFAWRAGPRRITTWLLLEDGSGEVCPFDPGFGDDLVVTVHDPLVFARWHLGLTSWAAALRSRAVEVSGPPDLRRALPTWNAGPDEAIRRRVP